MDLVSTVRKSGSRGGVNFSWNDVTTSSYRENYLGHSLKAPVGRWAKGRDLGWYAKGDDGVEDERARRDEIRRVKEAEEDAMARALGRPVPVRDSTGANAVDIAPGRMGDRAVTTDTDDKPEANQDKRHRKDDKTTKEGREWRRHGEEIFRGRKADDYDRDGRRRGPRSRSRDRERDEDNEDRHRRSERDDRRRRSRSRGHVDAVGRREQKRERERERHRSHSRSDREHRHEQDNDRYEQKRSHDRQPRRERSMSPASRAQARKSKDYRQRSRSRDPTDRQWENRTNRYEKYDRDRRDTVRERARSPDARRRPR